MKVYDISYVDVTCLQSIEDAMNNSCEIHKYYGSRAFVGYEFRPIFALIQDSISKQESVKLKESKEIELVNYKNTISELKDFYKVFSELTPQSLSLEEFNELHSLIHRNGEDSRENFPSEKLKQLIATISYRLLMTTSQYFTGIKIFSIKNEIIVIIDFPVVKVISDAFDDYGKPIQYKGFFLKKPRNCIRFKASKY